MNPIKSLILSSAVIALSAAALINAPMAAGPEGSGREGKPFHGRRMHGEFGGGARLISIALRHKSDLNLSSDQVNSLETIRTNYQNQMAPPREQVRSIGKEIADLMQQTPADLILVKSKIQEAEKPRSDLRYLRLEALEKGKAVLSQQQRDQLNNLIRSKREHFRGRHRQPS